MRIEGSVGMLPIHRAGRAASVARLHDVSRAEIHPSRNRMIAATGRAPNATAAAPVRRLTSQERARLESPDVPRARETPHPTPPAPGRAPAASAATEHASERTPRPPSVPIVPADPADEETRRTARADFGAEVVQAYTRAQAASAPAPRFDILA